MNISCHALDTLASVGFSNQFSKYYTVRRRQRIYIICVRAYTRAFALLRWRGIYKLDGAKMVAVVVVVMVASGCIHIHCMYLYQYSIGPRFA